jgi:hypothetical protein
MYFIIQSTLICQEGEALIRKRELPRFRVSAGFSKNSAIGETLIEGSGGTFAARPVMA